MKFSLNWIARGFLIFAVSGMIESHAATTATLIDSLVKDSAARTNYGGTLGVQFRFTGSTGGQVTELGIYDGNSVPGLQTNHLLSLYAVEQIAASSGTLLASVNVPAGATGGETNAYVYATLTTPVTLTNGNYYVVAADYPTNDTVDPFYNVGPASIASDIGSEFISRFSDSTGNPGTFVPHHDFPNVVNTPLGAYAGPNLKIVPIAEAPLIRREPVARSVYEGHTAKFNVQIGGSPPMEFQWQAGPAGGPFTNIVDGGQISGAGSTSLTLSNVTLENVGDYFLIATNSFGSATSAVAKLSVLPTPAAVTNRHAFAEAVMTNQPLTYWRMNDAPGALLIYDSMGNHDAINENTTMGVSALRTPEHPGFSATNTAAYFDGFSSSVSSASSLMNGLGEFTIVGWFSPGGPNSSLRTGLFGQNDALELGFNDTEGISLWFPVGQNWLQLTSGNNGFAVDEWYFVAVVASESTVTIYINGVQRAQSGGIPSGSSTSAFNIGGGGIFDPSGNYFNGRIEDVAVFNRGFSRQEVQRLYGVAVGFFTPAIYLEPAARTALLGGSVQFVVGAEGGQLSYQWQSSLEDELFTNLINGGNLGGANSSTLTINSVSLADAADFRVVITNVAGSVTSESARLTVLPRPGPETYGSTVLSLNPVAYWRFDETDDPASTTVQASDHAGQFHGTYGTAVRNGHTNYSVSGPLPSDGFTYFETNNRAIQIVPGTNNSWVTVPPLDLNTNEVSIAAWIKPVGPIADYSAVFFARGAGDEIFGLGFGGGTSPHLGVVNYTWTSSPDTWDWITNVRPATNQWSFVTLTVKATEAWMYHNGEPIAINVLDHTNLLFNTTGTIGTDLIAPVERTFNGLIDEVAVFNYFLSRSQVKSLYTLNRSRLSIDAGSEGELTVSWDKPGTLEYAYVLEGVRTLWFTEGTNSPVTLTNISGARYFRVVADE